MDSLRKRPRPEGSPADDQLPTSPTIALLQTQINTLQTQLTHSQSMRALERKSFQLNEERLKRQVADAHLEMEQHREINEAMQIEMEQMEGQMGAWVERAREAEEMSLTRPSDVHHHDDCSKCILLQQRLDATVNQVNELTKLLQQAQQMASVAEVKASTAELKLSQLEATQEAAPIPAATDENNCTPQILRATRLQLSQTERVNRELARQNNEMKVRLKDMVKTKEKMGSAQRTVAELEKEVQQLQQRVESGQVAERRWMEIRKEIVEEGLVGDDCDCVMVENEHFSVLTVGVPPEIATVVRKFQGLKYNISKMKEENARLVAVSDEKSQRCAQYDKQLREKAQLVSSLEKEVKTANETIQHLELENRKIMAQQVIWKRESEGMRSLLDTYEMQETKSAQLKQSKPKSQSDDTPIVKGLQLSLKSSQDETKLLSETNQRLETEIDSLKAQQQAARAEHERVLEKFGKLRSALMEERSKAQAAEERACHAETLAGKGSYNAETTRVLHLETNPLSDAIREKYQAEIDSLKQRLEQAEQLATETSSLAEGTTTPAPSSRSKGSFGSGATSDGLSSLDAQKLHKRLKERFKEQIGLFREGVYLLTGCKIDMSFSDSDCPHFKVRSMYSEREEDHLMFQWNRKKGEDNDLDLMSTDLAQLLMSGPSAIYMTKFCSVPAFMASVTLEMFEKQTMV